jgi:hypothetical protein
MCSPLHACLLCIAQAFLVAAATAFDVWQDTRLPKLRGSETWRVSVIIPVSSRSQNSCREGCVVMDSDGQPLLKT